MQLCYRISHMPQAMKIWLSDQRERLPTGHLNNNNNNNLKNMLAFFGVTLQEWALSCCFVFNIFSYCLLFLNYIRFLGGRELLTFWNKTKYIYIYITGVSWHLNLTSDQNLEIKNKIGATFITEKCNLTLKTLEWIAQPDGEARGTFLEHFINFSFN